MGEAENEEVVGGGAAAEDGGDGVEFGGGHSRWVCRVWCGSGVVEEGVEDGFW